MFGLIGIIVVAIIGWAIFKMVLCRIFPEYGLREAEKRYKRDPDDINERLLWEARSRVQEKEARDKAHRR